MSIYTKLTRFDRCVWWKATGPDDYGRMQYEQPVELGCRWDDVQIKYEDSKGEEKVSKAIVYVSRDVQPEGFLWHGKLKDLPGDLLSPLSNEDAWEIKKFSKMYNIKNTKFIRKAIL